MTHTRTRVVTRFAFPLFAVALLALGVRAAEPGQEQADDLKAIRDLVMRIEQRMVNQQAATDVLMEIVRKDLKDLREEVARLQRELTDMRNRASDPTTIAQYGGTPSASLSVPVPTANIRLVNTYFIEMSALINGIVYTVPPGQQRIVPVPSGAVNYQVFQVPEPMRARTLVPNETLTLTLFPR